MQNLPIVKLQPEPCPKLEVKFEKDDQEAPYAPDFKWQPDDLFLPKIECKTETQSPPQSKLVDPSDLKENFIGVYHNIITKEKKRKATNIPKFLLKVFKRNLPPLQLPHRARIDKFYRHLSSCKTRFDIFKLFGRDVMNPSLDSQNSLNRAILKRTLGNSYDNILANDNIHQLNKRIYLMFSRKIMLRLDLPETLDRLK